MQFETIISDDLEEIRNLQPDNWSDIIPIISYYTNSDFCYPVKVIEDYRIIGIGTSIVLEFTSWLAHIIVDTEYRNQGIGYQIVDYLLNNSIPDSSQSVLLIATKQGETIYRRAGFRIVTEYGFYKREASWNNQSIVKKIVPFGEKYRSEILELDKKITGEDRSRILWENLASSLLYVNHDQVEGYYMPNMGDGPIIADTTEAGVELMTLKYASVDKAVLPVENTVGITFLQENGFEESSKALRMILGKDLDWEPEKIYSRIGGNFG